MESLKTAKEAVTNVVLDGAKDHQQTWILAAMTTFSTRVAARIPQRVAMAIALLATTSGLGACSTVEGLLPGSNLATACKTFKDEMAAHAKANPAVNGNLDQAANAAWGKKNQEILETFFKATGVTYNNSNDLDAVRENMTALVQASAKCKVAGVDMINN